MPKIKFTTLVAGMKGKSQGSVFSNNKGGAYFRNNKQGGKKASPKQGKQKALLSNVSSAWRLLDQDQQDAWNSAVALYPTMNAFGDARIPSGYELYMRLNGALVSNSVAPLLVPAVPRDVPPTGALTMDFPDNFQFNPNSVTALDEATNGGKNTNVHLQNFFSAFDPESAFSISFRIKLNFDIRSNALTFSDQNLLTSSIGSGKTMYLALRPLNALSALLFFKFEAGGLSCEWTREIPIDALIEAPVICVSKEAGGIESTIVYVDDTNYPDSITDTGTYTPTTFTGDLYIGADDNSVPNNYTVSDFRFFENYLTSDNMLLVKYGYLLGNEVWKVPFNHVLFNGQFESFPVADSRQAYVGQLTAVSSVIIPFSFQLFPKWTIETENYGTSGHRLNIFASKPLSRGKNGAMSNYAQIGSFPWQFNKVQEIDGYLKEALGYLPPESQVRFYIQQFDAVTGQVDRNKQEVTQKKPRFKAGTELPDKVN